MTRLGNGIALEFAGDFEFGDGREVDNLARLRRCDEP